jgi:hypothetical protein
VKCAAVFYYYFGYEGEWEREEKEEQQKEEQQKQVHRWLEELIIFVVGCYVCYETEFELNITLWQDQLSCMKRIVFRDYIDTRKYELTGNGECMSPLTPPTQRPACFLHSDCAASSYGLLESVSASPNRKSAKERTPDANDKTSKAWLLI